MKKHFKYLVLVLLLLFNCTYIYSQVWYDIKIENYRDAYKLIFTISNNSNENIIISDSPFRVFLGYNKSLLFPFLPKMRYQPNTIYFYKDSLNFINTGTTDYESIKFSKLSRISIFKQKVVVFSLPRFVDSTFLDTNYLLSFIMFAKERDILNSIYSTKKEIRDSLKIYYESKFSDEDTLYVSKFLINYEMDKNEKPNEFLLDYLNKIIFNNYNVFVWDSKAIEHLWRIHIYKEM